MTSMAAGITRPKCSIWCQYGAKKWLLFVLFAARRCRSSQGKKKTVKAYKQWLHGLFQSGDPNGIDSASPLPSGRPLVDLPRFWLGSNCVRIRLRRSVAVASDPNGIRIFGFCCSADSKLSWNVLCIRALQCSHFIRHVNRFGTLWQTSARCVSPFVPLPTTQRFMTLRAMLGLNHCQSLLSLGHTTKRDAPTLMTH